MRFGAVQELFDVPGDVFDKIDPEIRFKQQMEREADSILEHYGEQLAD